MSDSAETGAVNNKGQVYSSNSGTAVYESLYIADGSIIPTPVGVNTLFTISALAERINILISKDRGWHIDMKQKKHSELDW